jgi:hypothetical protein
MYHKVAAAQSSFVTVLEADAHAHVQRLVSVVRMATVFEECATEEQRCVVLLFLWAKGLNVDSIHMKYLLFTVGSVCCVKRFTAGSRNSLKDVRKSQMMPDQLRKWLRQQSKDFSAADFDALVRL